MRLPGKLAKMPCALSAQTTQTKSTMLPDIHTDKLYTSYKPTAHGKDILTCYIVKVQSNNGAQQSELKS